jgi:type II secretory ATPase GspE/PulE/Tfp pilus assembly ATPase PilB-like protein
MKDRNYSPAYGPAQGLTSPLCEKCRNPVRKEAHKTKNNFPALASNPPWNSGWYGKCEYCGYDYNISFTQILRQTPDNQIESGRKTRISVASRGYAVFYDEGESLSGIEIEIISHGRFFGEEIEKIFISTNELKQIITILRDSPILKQFDWGEDWT